MKTARACWSISCLAALAPRRSSARSFRGACITPPLSATAAAREAALASPGAAAAVAMGDVAFGPQTGTPLKNGLPEPIQSRIAECPAVRLPEAARNLPFNDISLVRYDAESRLLWLAGVYPLPVLFDDYLPYYFLLGFAEAWLNGADMRLPYDASGRAR